MPKVRGNDNIGRFLTELRRSNASGLHVKKVPRGNVNRREIQMSIQDADYPGAVDTDFNREPTERELQEAEEEYQNLHLDNLDEEDWERFYRVNSGYPDGDYPHEHDDPEYDELDLYDMEYDVP